MTTPGPMFVDGSAPIGSRPLSHAAPPSGRWALFSPTQYGLGPNLSKKNGCGPAPGRRFGFNAGRKGGLAEPPEPPEGPAYQRPFREAAEWTWRATAPDHLARSASYPFAD